jgi:5'/3'-nucleotidase
MDREEKLQILLTNDDGIGSPGLWAAAEALSQIGYVWVAAPRDQASATGRSMPITSDGLIKEKRMGINGKEWTVYEVGGTPAQTVQYAILEIIGKKPDLVVSGINYGLNIGTIVTASGTIGAAMEGASFKVPSLAISLDTAKEHRFTYSRDVDFTTAAYFTKYFGKKMLEKRFSPRVQILKVEVPAQAVPETEWELTKLSLEHYYYPLPPSRESWDVPERITYHTVEDLSIYEPGSDTYTVLVDKKVAVTPLSLDMTANASIKELENILREDD